MPIFESHEGQLRPMHQLLPGAALYESEIEGLIWNNLEAFFGADLFPVARQPSITTGGRPDVLAIDENGRVVVVEVKRSIERSQLAQCLEYAGWAAHTNLDELSGLYHAGVEQFFADWLEFTGTATPLLVNPSPILLLVAQEFNPRTRDALDYLATSGVPVFLVPVSVYVDAARRRYYLIQSNFDDSGLPDKEGTTRAKPVMYLYNGRRVTVADLIEAGDLVAGETIEYRRAREGKIFPATLLDDGRIQVEDGRVFDSLSRAAATLAGVGALPGWEVWFAPDRVASASWTSGLTSWRGWPTTEVASRVEHRPPQCIWSAAGWGLERAPRFGHAYWRGCSHPAAGAGPLERVDVSSFAMLCRWAGRCSRR